MTTPESNFNQPPSEPIIEADFVPVEGATAKPVENPDPVKIDIPNAKNQEAPQEKAQEKTHEEKLHAVRERLNIPQSSGRFEPMSATSVVEQTVGKENVNTFFLATLAYMEKEIKEKRNKDVLDEAFRIGNTNEIVKIMKELDSQQLHDLQVRFDNAMAEYKKQGKENGKPNLLEVTATPKDTKEILKIMFNIDQKPKPVPEESLN